VRTNVGLVEGRFEEEGVEIDSGFYCNQHILLQRSVRIDIAVVDVKTDEVDVDSEAKEGKSEEKFKFRISSKSDGLKLDIESQSKDEKFKDERKFTLFFDRVVQFVGDTAYTGGATVGNDYLLGNANWNAFSCPQSGEKYICGASTRDGLLQFTFEFSGEPFTDGDLQLDPLDFKISVFFRGWNFAGTAPNTKLALLVYGKAKVEFKDREVSGSKKLVNTGGSAFSWVDTATVNNSVIDVKTSAVAFSDDGAEKKFAIWFSFMADRPTAIDWDPVVSTNAANSMRVLSVLLLLFLAALL